MALHHEPLSSGPPPSGGVTMERLRSQRPQIMEIAARHRATNVRVIGSVARNTSDQRSDVDFMVDMDPERKLKGFAYFGELDDLVNDLSALLGCKVDVVDAVSFRRNKPTLRSTARFRERLMREAIPL